MTFIVITIVSFAIKCCHLALQFVNPITVIVFMLPNPVATVYTIISYLQRRLTTELKCTWISYPQIKTTADKKYTQIASLLNI